MKLNTDKCYFLISGPKYEQMRTEIRQKDKIWESSDNSILDVTTDYKPNFDSHIAHFLFESQSKGYVHSSIQPN